MAKQKKFMSHILTGISYMIPVVVAGGILGALAKAFGGWNIGSAVEAGATPFSNLNPFTWIGFWWGVNKLSSYAMDFAVAVMTAGAAYSIAGRPGIVPGMVIGYCSSQSKAGFLGGMLMAFIIGYVVNWMKGWKLPKWCEGLKPVMIIPVCSTFICGMIFLCVFSIPLSFIMNVFQQWIISLNGGAKAVIGAVIGACMGFDMGGPVKLQNSAQVLSGSNVSHMNILRDFSCTLTVIAKTVDAYHQNILIIMLQENIDGHIVPATAIQIPFPT